MTKIESNPVHVAAHLGPIGYVRLIVESLGEGLRLRNEMMKRNPRSYIVE